MLRDKVLRPVPILAYWCGMIRISQTPPHKPAYRAARSAGKDWPEIADRLLQALQIKDNIDPTFTCGFLFMTDTLARDMGPLLARLQEATGIHHWAGCSGVGVLDGHGHNSDGTLAASLLLCNFPADSVVGLPIQQQGDYLALPDTLHSWLKHHGPPFGIVFADPFPQGQMATLLHSLSRQAGAFLVGGVSSGMNASSGNGQLGGLLLSSQIYIQTAMTQGCIPIGPPHTITKLQNGMIAGLDGQPALHVFASDLRHMVLADIGQDPDNIAADDTALEEKFQHLFQGEIHIGLSIPGSDRGDYVVRPMVGVEAQTEAIMLADTVHEGMVMRFVRRNDTTVTSDLQRMLDDLNKRAETAPNPPRAALYIACAGRASSDAMRQDELVMLRQVLGDIPLAGFYAGGEIFREDAHSFAGILTLFY